MKLKKILLILIFGIYCYNIFSQDISTRIFVIMEKRDHRNDSMPGFFKTTIKQNISFNDIVSDTIYLALENTNMWGLKYTFSEIECFDIGRNERINFKFDEETIAIPVTQTNFDIELKYQYNPISCIQFMQSFYFGFYSYDWQGWFFSHSNMKIENVTVSVSDYYYFFSNQPMISQDNIYHLNTSNLTSFRIDMLFLEKIFYYEKYSFSDNSNTFNIYFSKNTGVNSDSTALIPVDKDSLLIAKCINSIKTCITKINNVFPEQANKNFTIVDAGFNFENMAYGTKIDISENNFLLIIDTSFWNDYSLTHELLHCFLPYKTEPTDSAKFLLEESIIEYLSVYFYYDEIKYDSIFNDKIVKIKEIDNVSIFSVIENRSNASTGEGTWRIVYNKAPAIIHEFAQKLGGDNIFVDLLFKYYQTIDSNNIIKFNDMKNFFLSNGVTKEDWQWFERNL